MCGGLRRSFERQGHEFEPDLGSPEMFSSDSTNGLFVRSGTRVRCGAGVESWPRRSLLKKNVPSLFAVVSRSIRKWPSEILPRCLCRCCDVAATRGTTEGPLFACFG